MCNAAYIKTLDQSLMTTFDRPLKGVTERDLCVSIEYMNHARKEQQNRFQIYVVINQTHNLRHPIKGLWPKDTRSVSA